jgi:hypothetical protein
MMQDLTKTASELAAKVARERLSKRVANRIWVAETLAFDDFYRVITEFEG